MITSTCEYKDLSIEDLFAYAADRGTIEVTIERCSGSSYLIIMQTRDRCYERISDDLRHGLLRVLDMWSQIEGPLAPKQNTEMVG